MSKVKRFILDTNVVLYDNKCIYSFEENNVIIPIYVIEELDKFKNGNTTLNFNAREFIRIIESMPREKVYDGGAFLGEGLGKIRVVTGYPYHKKVSAIFPDQTVDNLILNTAYYLSGNGKTTIQKITGFLFKIVSWLWYDYFFKKEENENGGEFVLVSKDVNLRMKAGALNINAEDYKNDSVANSDSFYEEARSVEVLDEITADLYSHGTISLPDVSDFYENEFTILNPNREKPSLVRFNKGKLYLIHPHVVSPFGVKARNSEQEFALNALLDPKLPLVSMVGIAGTGKTLLALAAGLQGLKEGIYDQILITRHIIALSNHDMGFLPGDANDKISPYMRGFEDNLGVIRRLSSSNEALIKEYKKSEKIMAEPLDFIRGRTFTRTYFIIDETQNIPPVDVLTIVTRAGEGSKFVFSGDICQIDSPLLDQSSNGLTHLISRMKNQDIYAHINLLKCERSYLAKLAAKLLK